MHTLLSCDCVICVARKHACVHDCVCVHALGSRVWVCVCVYQGTHNKKSRGGRGSAEGLCPRSSPPHIRTTHLQASASEELPHNLSTLIGGTAMAYNALLLRRIPKEIPSQPFRV